MTRNEPTAEDYRAMARHLESVERKEKAVAALREHRGSATGQVADDLADDRAAANKALRGFIYQNTTTQTQEGESDG